MKLPEKEAAAYLGNFQPKTLANWRSRGEGPPHYRVGGRILYDKADLDTYLESCRRTSTAASRRPGAE